MTPKVNPAVNIGLAAEQAHACIDHITDQYPEPLLRLIQLAYVQEVLDHALRQAQKSAMPEIMERNIYPERTHFDVGAHGVRIEVDFADSAFIYRNNPAYRALAEELAKMKKGMREAEAGFDSGYPPAKRHPGKYKVKVHLTGTMKRYDERGEEEVEA